MNETASNLRGRLDAIDASGPTAEHAATYLHLRDQVSAFCQEDDTEDARLLWRCIDELHRWAKLTNSGQLDDARLRFREWQAWRKIAAGRWAMRENDSRSRGG